jgi:hypothetical protein
VQSRWSRRAALKLAGATGLGITLATRVRPAQAALAGSYELVDLAETDPNPASPIWVGINDMNASGVIAGNIWVSDEKRSPWTAAGGKLSRIKTGEYGGMLTAINDAGVLAGRELLGWHSAEHPWGRPVLWIEGEKEMLPYPDTLPSAGESGRAYDVNNDNTAVGAVQIAGGASYPVIWRNGEPVVLPSIFELGQGTAMLINDDGVAFGVIDDGAGGAMGAVWDGDTVSPLFGLSGVDGPVQPQGLGADGLPLGMGWSGASWDAMAWPGLFDEPQVLPQLVPGQLQAVAVSSDAGSLIGGAVVVAEGDQRGVVWDGDQAIDAGTLVENLDGVQLLVIRAFGPDGVLAANARYPDNTIHAVLLQPAD